MCVILWVSTPGGESRPPPRLGLKPQAGEYPPFQGGSPSPPGKKKRAPLRLPLRRLQPLFGQAPFPLVHPHLGLRGRPLPLDVGARDVPGVGVGGAVFPFAAVVVGPGVARGDGLLALVGAFDVDRLLLGAQLLALRLLGVFRTILVALLVLAVVLAVVDVLAVSVAPFGVVHRGTSFRTYVQRAGRGPSPLGGSRRDRGDRGGPWGGGLRRGLRRLLRLLRLLPGGLAGEARPRRGQPGDRHPVGGAGDVVEAHPLEEVDRLRIAAVLAADAQMEVRPRLAAALAGQADELTHPL